MPRGPSFPVGTLGLVAAKGKQMLDRRLVSPTEISDRPLQWLWPDRIPQAAITVLDGDPGSGKSTVTYDIAARVTIGRPMPGRDTATIGPAGVILIQGEDLAGQTVLPNLRAAGADLTKIKLLDRGRFIEAPLLLPNDIPVLEQAVAEVQAKLVVIDPFTAFLAGNSNRDAVVRKALGPLATFAERLDLAVLIVRHLRKSGANNPLYAGLGSIGIIGSVRSGLMVLDDPGSDDLHQHVLAQSKGNFASAPALVYQTIKHRDGTIGVEWLGTSQYTAADLMRGVADDNSAVAEAAYVLYSILAEGPVAAKYCVTRAKNAAVSERTLKRAKKQIGVRSWKEGSGANSRWLWELPDDPVLHQRFKEKDLTNLVERLIHGNVAGDQSDGKAGVDREDRRTDGPDDDGGDAPEAVA
jgi:hypothetical protein